MFDHIATNGRKLTVLELVEKYVSLKTGVRHNTAPGHKTVIKILKKESFVRQRIDKGACRMPKHRSSNFRRWIAEGIARFIRFEVFSDLHSRWRWMMT